MRQRADEHARPRAARTRPTATSSAGGRSSGAERLERRARLRSRCGALGVVAVGGLAVVGHRVRLPAPRRAARAARARPARVLGGGDRAQHAHARGARVERLAEVARVEAADREERHRRVRGRVADQLEADRRPPGLGRRLVDRADADVVDDARRRPRRSARASGSTGRSACPGRPARGPPRRACRPGRRARRRRPPRARPTAGR